MFLQLLFIVTAQKRMESWEKKDTKPHYIPSNWLTVEQRSLSLKVNRLDSPHSRPNFTEPFASRLWVILCRRDARVIHQRDTAAWRRSLPVIRGTTCVPRAFMHLKEARTNITNNRRRYNDYVWFSWVWQRFFQYTRTTVAWVNLAINKTGCGEERTANQPVL